MPRSFPARCLEKLNTRVFKPDNELIGAEEQYSSNSLSFLFSNSIKLIY